MRKWLSALLLSLSTVSAATSLTRDYSDLWFVPAESGWGVNVIQQGEILFATLFVYQTTTQPVWYVASEIAFQSTNGNTQTFTGLLYQTTGPWFGAAFNPANVNVQAVGTMTFAFTSPSTATLTYSVGTANVTKNIVRQTWRIENYAGTYAGATIGTYSGCGTTVPRGGSNGPYDAVAALTVTQSGNGVTIIESGSGYQCSYTGILTQAGRMGTVIGTGSCAPGGAAQVFTASEVQVSPEGLSARLVADAGACRFTGRIGGIRRS